MSNSFQNPSGSFFSESGGIAARVVEDPTSGDTVTMRAGERRLYVNKGSTIAALTVKLPGGVSAGDTVLISSKNVITTLTVQDWAGTEVASGVAAATAAYRFHYVNAALGWKNEVAAVTAAAIDGLTASATELNYNDITTLGTGAASKAVVLDSNGRYRLPSNGTFFNAGKQTKAQAAPAAKTVTAAITAAELVAGLITTTGATGPSEHQLPTGTLIDAAIPGIATGDSFDFTVINTGTGASDDATLTVNTDVTIVGNPTVGALTDATIISGSGTFRARRSAANTYVVYRIA